MNKKYLLGLVVLCLTIELWSMEKELDPSINFTEITNSSRSSSHYLHNPRPLKRLRYMGEEEEMPSVNFSQPNSLLGLLEHHENDIFLCVLFPFLSSHDIYAEDSLEENCDSALACYSKKLDRIKNSLWNLKMCCRFTAQLCHKIFKRCKLLFQGKLLDNYFTLSNEQGIAYFKDGTLFHQKNEFNEILESLLFRKANVLSSLSKAEYSEFPQDLTQVGDELNFLREDLSLLRMWEEGELKIVNNSENDLKLVYLLCFFGIGTHAFIKEISESGEIPLINLIIDEKTSLVNILLHYGPWPERVENYTYDTSDTLGELSYPLFILMFFNKLSLGTIENVIKIANVKEGHLYDPLGLDMLQRFTREVLWEGYANSLYNTPYTAKRLSRIEFIIECFLKYGFLVNNPLTLGNSGNAVTLACNKFQGSPEIAYVLINKLINAGASVNIENDQGKTALWFLLKQAIKWQTDPTPLLGLILKDNWSINTYDKVHGYSPLLMACYTQEYQKIIPALLQAGGDVNMLHPKRETVLLCICKYPFKSLFVNDNIEEEEYLLEGAEKKRVDVISFLLSQGAKPTISDSQGNTPFWYCAKRTCKIIKQALKKGDVSPQFLETCIEMIKLIRSNDPFLSRPISKNISVQDLVSSSIATYYMYLCNTAGQFNTLKAVLNRCPRDEDEINNVDESGKTVLMFLCSNFPGQSTYLKENRLALINLLLTYNPNVEIIDKNQDTALILACKYFVSLPHRFGAHYINRCIVGDVIRELLYYGANPYHRNSQGKTAAHILNENGYDLKQFQNRTAP